MWIFFVKNFLFISFTEELREYCEGDFCVSLNEERIGAEAGLCVVIPCSFKLTSFTSVQMIWLKCESWRTRCPTSEAIFHSYDHNAVQTGFRGRVSLLEPEVRQRNCSIIINDLTESDSGSYQFRVAGYNYLYGRWDGYTFSRKVTVQVTGKKSPERFKTLLRQPVGL